VGRDGKRLAIARIDHVSRVDDAVSLQGSGPRHLRADLGVAVIAGAVHAQDEALAPPGGDDEHGVLALLK
jgi:hypothetical protein